MDRLREGQFTVKKNKGQRWLTVPIEKPKGKPFPKQGMAILCKNGRGHAVKG
jgi:hypothetical protein